MATLKRVNGHRYLYRRGDWFYFRRGVPADARSAFDNQAEVLAGLRTTDLSRARFMLGRHLGVFESKLAAARSRLREKVASNAPPSFVEIDEAVRVWLEQRRQRYFLDFNGGDGEARGREMLASLRAQLEDGKRSLGISAKEPSMNVRWVAEAIAQANGWKVDPQSSLERRLFQRVARGQVEATHEQISELEGDPAKPFDDLFAADQYRLDTERRRDRGASTKAVSFSGLFDGYIAEHKPKPATIKAWKRFVASFTDFLKHDDAARVEPADFVAWKEHLLAGMTVKGTPRSPKTVKETYMAAIRAVYRWGVSNSKIANDPTEKISVHVPRKPRHRSKGFTDDEALKILCATIADHGARLSPQRRLARRWVPWLCAYTGARVNEMTQLRAEDVQHLGKGMWTILITPEAGGVKDGNARVVPLHPHLVEQGFPEEIKGKVGPLFYDPSAYRGGSEGNPQYKKTGERLAQWVREDVGVDDPRIAPNHGWRHRFMTDARNVRMREEIRDAIQGHVPRTEGEKYGDTSPTAMLREIKLLRRYKV